MNATLKIHLIVIGALLSIRFRHEIWHFVRWNLWWPIKRTGSDFYYWIEWKIAGSPE